MKIVHLKDNILGSGAFFTGLQSKDAQHGHLEAMMDTIRTYQMPASLPTDAQFFFGCFKTTVAAGEMPRA